MIFCKNCGTMIDDDAKFCPNCGTAVKSDDSNVTPNVDYSMNNMSYESSAMGNSIPVQPKKTWVDKFSMFFGIILLILALVDYYSDPPVWTILLSVGIIAGAIICLSQKYRLKGFTIVALILAVYCLLAGIRQGQKLGFFRIPTAADYKYGVQQNVNNNAASDANYNYEHESSADDYSSYDYNNASESGSYDYNGTNGESDVVDPELKAFLDSYEDFVDEYVVFMKKYSSDPTNAMSMLSEYTRIMDRYADFMEKVDQYDSNSMSTADAKYYIEVTNRCSQKMLSIY